MSAPDGSPVGAERSIGQLFATATAEMSALVHDEIALAKAQLRQDVKRGATSGGAFMAAGVLLLFSLPMLNFALAYGIRTWSGWNMAVCFLLSFAANCSSPASSPSSASCSPRRPRRAAARRRSPPR